MFFIAQLYGVQLEKLYKMNQMEAGTEPLNGEKIRLRGKTSKSQNAPKTVQAGADNHMPKRDVLVWEPEQDVEVNQKDEEAEEKEMIFNHIEAVFQEDNPSKEEDTTLELPNTDDSKENIDALETIELPELPPFEEEADHSNDTSTHQVHTVVKGDTLYKISKRYNITVDALKSMNQLYDNNIKIGQQLVVKK
jgi:LysM repeat protein